MTASLDGARVTVMGLGQFGGGLGAARWLLGQGAHVTVTDKAAESLLAGAVASVREVAPLGRLRLALGGHEERDFTETDLVVANPAVPQPWDNPFLEAARRKGVPITTEVGLLVDRLPTDRVVGITGTAGKSTVTSMTLRLLQSAGATAWIGGNFGGSLLAELDRITPKDWVVLELSSFMLHWLGTPEDLGWSPRVAVLTNLAPNHLDWHRTMAHYSQSKAVIRRFQRPGDRFVTRFERESPAAAAAAGDTPLGRWWRAPWEPARGPSSADGIRLPMPGEHSRRNAALAMDAACAALSLEAAEADHHAAFATALEAFEPLPHRLQFIGEFRGLRCFNDSKSTTPEATLLAVNAFPEPRRVHLVAGGYDKQADLTPIRELAGTIGGLYAIGATAPKLVGGPGAMPCGTLEGAVSEAARRASPGDVLLLSPGCASWDQFTNFEERGRRFTELVRSL